MYSIYIYTVYLWFTESINLQIHAELIIIPAMTFIFLTRSGIINFCGLAVSHVLLFLPAMSFSNRRI